MHTIHLLLILSMTAATTGDVSSRQSGYLNTTPLSTTREYDSTIEEDYYTRRRPSAKYNNYDNPVNMENVNSEGGRYETVYQNEEPDARDDKPPSVRQNQKSTNGVDQSTEGAKDEYNPDLSESSTYSGHDTIPGVAGTDFPDYIDVPLTSFYCHRYNQAGYYADIETGCQVFHVCDVDGRQDSFLCPRGTIFNQPYLTCDWWFNVDCPGAADYYGISTDLHKTATSTSLQHLTEPSADATASTISEGHPKYASQKFAS